MYFKKIVSMIGLLNSLIPSSLSVVACNINQTKNIINTIDEINDLEIFISSEDEAKTVFEILSNPNFGIFSAINNYRTINNNFKKELFKLDFENIYFDKTKIKRVSEADKIVANNTYYFQYFYKDKENTILVPIKIKNDNETLVVKNINRINFIRNIAVNTTINILKAEVSAEFIKQYLNEDIKKIFNNNLFEIHEIKNGNQTLTDHDFKEPKQIKEKMIYSYGSIKNQETNLTINVNYTEQQIVNEINNTSYQTSIIMKTNIKDFIRDIITKDFIKNGIKDINIKNVFDKEKLEIFLIKNNKNVILEDSDFNEVQKINAMIHYKYNNIAGSASLLISINVTDQLVINEINNFKYRYDVVAKTKKKEVTRMIKKNKDFIKNGIKDVNIRNYFDAKKLEIHSIKKLNSNSLDDSDFKKPVSKIDAVINYIYNGVKGIQQTRLIIYITE